MRNIIVGLLSFAALPLLSACGSSESRKYQFVQNGCDTGEHQFDSQDAECEGLKNDKLNNECAYGLRKQAFLEKCPGKAWE